MNIFISNLDFKVESNDLTDFFSPYGEVISSKVITDRVTGKSRGFGFVEMASDVADQDVMARCQGEAAALGGARSDVLDTPGQRQPGRRDRDHGPGAVERERSGCEVRLQ